jgi:DNA-binding NarL/FixJ family response regulator
MPPPHAGSPTDGVPLGRPQLRVVVADDNLLVREGVERILAADTGMNVVASCGDLPSLLEAIENARPDVLVTDVRLPPASSDEGIRVAAQLREQRPEIGVVVLSNDAEPGHALALLKPGSDGRAYLLKERINDGAQLVAAVELVAAGDSVLDAGIVESLVAAKLRTEDSPLAGLTGREREVLAEIATGDSNAAIADTLFLTKRAVEKHINSIFIKLNLALAQDVSKRVTATLLFLAHPDSAHPV